MVKEDGRHTIGSLFSGIGGIELGFEWAGFRTAWFVENDAYCQQVLRKRFPSTKIYGDIATVDFGAVPRVDILTGGLPCQDISNVGKRVGITGSRSSLWRYYKEAVRVLRPKFAFIENVSALTYRGLDIVLADLAEIGYDAEWYCVPASSVGALHKRERVFIIAYPHSYGFDSSKKRTQGEILLHPNEKRNDATILVGQQQKQFFDIKQDGIVQYVADSDSERFQERWKSESDAQADYSPECNCQDVADTAFKRLYEQTNEQKLEGEWGGEFQSCKSRDFGWWAVEPDVGRVAHGIPNRVHRIRCLGNAVVPQVAEVFARAIQDSCR